MDGSQARDIGGYCVDMCLPYFVLIHQPILIQTPFNIRLDRGIKSEHNKPYERRLKG
jgi:hypothetical protein